MHKYQQWVICNDRTCEGSNDSFHPSEKGIPGCCFYYLGEMFYRTQIQLYTLG